MFKDINPGSGSSGAGGFTDVGGTLYFTADDGTHGREFWMTNGTEAGIQMVMDIWEGPESSSPTLLMDINGTFYFVAADGSHGWELWKTGGTPENTVMLKDINTYGVGSAPEEFVGTGGTTFFTAMGGNHGRELWKTDRTGAGTVMVKDINPGADSSDLDHLTDVNGTLYFTALDATHGRELWKSDGSEGGTELVKDIHPGSASSDLDHLTTVGGTLYFIADDGSNGIELWQSDGTEAGTVMAMDILPGSASSRPHNLASVGGDLYFVVDAGQTGDEPWHWIFDPRVTQVDVGRDLRSLIVQLNDDDLDEDLAINRANFKVTAAGADGLFGTDDDRDVPIIDPIVYDAATDRITLRTEDLLFRDYFRLELDGDDGLADGTPGLTDLDGHFLDGGDFNATLDLTSLGMVDDLLATIDGLDLSTGAETSLVKNLEAAVMLLGMEVTNDMGVLALLNAFIAGVERWYDRGEIGEEDRDDLIAGAELIKLGLMEVV